MIEYLPNFIGVSQFFGMKRPSECDRNPNNHISQVSSFHQGLSLIITSFSILLTTKTEKNFPTRSHPQNLADTLI